MLAVVFATSPAGAKVQPFPAGFHPHNIPTNGTTLYVRIGGQGPAVLLIHGFGDTGDMWAPLAAELMKDHTVIVPDLRGMGLSAHPAEGYTKKNQAADIAGMLDYLKIDKVALVTHDIGNMVGYAFVVQYPGAGDPLGGDGCAAARHRRLGHHHPRSAPLAFQFPRARCRAPGRRPRAHLSRPFL